jgi:serine protease Do
VTVGVISAIERPYPVSAGRWQRVLQTDAAINPGNSGGPLLNLHGEVIGINTAIVASEAAPRNVGVGFAIPIDAVRDLLPELRKGTVTRGRIGVQITAVTKDLADPLGLDRARGALVRVVERAGPAAAAGIEPGDVITRYNEQAVDDRDQLVDLVTHTKPGTTVPVEIVREGERRTVRITVAQLDLEDREGQSNASVETEFGLSLGNLTPQISRRLELPAGRSGAVVTGVDPGGPAAAAGIRAGDVILEVGRMAIGSAIEADNGLRRVSEGGTAFVLLWRIDREVFVTMTRARGR